jgi:hypothetical protein
MDAIYGLNFAAIWLVELNVRNWLKAEIHVARHKPLALAAVVA